MRSLFVISGEDLVRALLRAGFHLTFAGHGVAKLRKETRDVEIPLTSLVEEPIIEKILTDADVRPLELVSLLSLVEDEARWRAKHGLTAMDTRQKLVSQPKR